MNIQCSGGSRSFTEETRALKMRSIVISHWKVTTTSWDPSLKQILLQLQKKLLKNSVSTILWSFSIWSKLERWKGSVSGCLLSWSQAKKSSFWSVIVSYSTKQLQTTFRSDCDVRQKVAFTQLAMTSAVAGLRGRSKASSNLDPKTNLRQNKKVMVTGGLLLSDPP